jgi:hypothetical protein
MKARICGAVTRGLAIRASAASALGTSSRAASVGSIPPGPPLEKREAELALELAMPWVTAGWVRCTIRDAELTLPLLAVATIALRCLRLRSVGSTG